MPMTFSLTDMRPLTDPQTGEARICERCNYHQAVRELEYEDERFPEDPYAVDDVCQACWEEAKR